MIAALLLGCAAKTSAPPPAELAPDAFSLRRAREQHLLASYHAAQGRTEAALSAHARSRVFLSDSTGAALDLYVLLSEQGAASELLEELLEEGSAGLGVSGLPAARWLHSEGRLEEAWAALLAPEVLETSHPEIIIRWLTEHAGQQAAHRWRGERLLRAGRPEDMRQWLADAWELGYLAQGLWGAELWLQRTNLHTEDWALAARWACLAEEEERCRRWSDRWAELDPTEAWPTQARAALRRADSAEAKSLLATATAEDGELLYALRGLDAQLDFTALTQELSSDLQRAWSHRLLEWVLREGELARLEGVSPLLSEEALRFARLQLLQAQGEHEEALLLTPEAPSRVEEALQRAEILSQLGRSEEARGLLARWRGAPLEPRARARLEWSAAQLSLSEGQAREALEQARLAQWCAPQELKMELLDGLMLDPEERLSWLLQSYEAAPGRKEIVAEVSRLYYEGARAGAARWFRPALPSPPPSSDAEGSR